MENGGYLSREQILEAEDIQYKDVPVPEWGGTVRVKELSGLERQEFDGDLFQIKQRMRVGGKRKRKGGKGSDPEGEMDVDVFAHKVKVRLCVLTICDEHGNRLFDDNQLEQLGAKSDKALDRVYQEAAALSGMAGDEEDPVVGESEGAAQPAT